MSMSNEAQKLKEARQEWLARHKREPQPQTLEQLYEAKELEQQEIEQVEQQVYLDDEGWEDEKVFKNEFLETEEKVNKGEITELSYTNRNLEYISPTLRLDLLEKIDMSQNKLDNMNAFGGFFPLLSELNLASNNIKFFILLNAPNLTKIDMSGNLISSFIKLSEEVDMTSVKEANFSNNKITDFSLFEFTPRLETLFAEQNRISDLGTLFKNREFLCPNLTQLVIAYNPIKRNLQNQAVAVYLHSKFGTEIISDNIDANVGQEKFSSLFSFFPQPYTYLEYVQSEEERRNKEREKNKEVNAYLSYCKNSEDPIDMEDFSASSKIVIIYNALTEEISCIKKTSWNGMINANKDSYYIKIPTLEEKVYNPNFGSNVDYLSTDENEEKPQVFLIDGEKHPTLHYYILKRISFEDFKKL